RRGHLHPRRGADVHRPADAEPADPAAGGDGGHAAAAAPAGRRPADRGRRGVVGGGPQGAVPGRSRGGAGPAGGRAGAAGGAGGWGGGAGRGRPGLRVVIPAELPEALAVSAATGLRSAAAAAGVDVAWLETALDAEFSLIRTRRADAGLGWLTASPDELPAPLDAMSLGQFEPDVWIP